MSDTLTARFVKRFPGSEVRISATLELPLAENKVTVLFGPSGCGKTTVLRCLAGLERPDEGLISLGADTWFDGARGIGRPPQHRQVGFLFQD